MNWLMKIKYIKLIEEDIGKIQKDLANYERVRRFVLLDKPLTLEDGEVTPTQKIKRKVVETKIFQPD